MTARHFLIILMTLFGVSISLSAQAATILTLNRDYNGQDCTWGPITIDQDELGWAVEQSWKGNEPTWGKVFPGIYPATATYRRDVGIELAFRDLPEHPLSVLTLGTRDKNMQGRLSIGQDLVNNCQVNSRKGYTVVSKRLTQHLFGISHPADGQSIDLQIRVVDR